MTNVKQSGIYPIISYSAKSHMGNVRSNNEDNLYCSGSILTPETRDTPFTMHGDTTAPCLFAVCDGMGGQDDGEFASFTAVSVLDELNKAVSTAPPEAIDALVQDYVTKVNRLLCDKMRERSVRIGTTLALIVVLDKEIKPYSIGDSRIYEFFDGNLRQLSIDHTLTSQKVKMGVLTEEQARNDRDRHKLTRYLGIFEDEMIIEAEPFPAMPLTECRLLLCSDGLTDMVADERIAEILASASSTDAASVLTDEALAAGGKDNVTCIVIDIKPQMDIQETKSTSKISRLFSGITGFIGKKSK